MTHLPWHFDHYSGNGTDPESILALNLHKQWMPGLCHSYLWHIDWQGQNSVYPHCWLQHTHICLGQILHSVQFGGHLYEYKIHCQKEGQRRLFTSIIIHLSTIWKACMRRSTQRRFILLLRCTDRKWCNEKNRDYFFHIISASTGKQLAFGKKNHNKTLSKQYYFLNH